MAMIGSSTGIGSSWAANPCEVCGGERSFKHFHICPGSKSASRSVPNDWEDKLKEILSLLSGDLNYDKNAKVKEIVKNLLS